MKFVMGEKFFNSVKVTILILGEWLKNYNWKFNNLRKKIILIYLKIEITLFWDINWIEFIGNKLMKLGI